MHVGTLTNVDFVFVFNQSTKDFKEGGQIKQFRAHIEFFIVSNAPVVDFLVLLDPALVAQLNPVR